MLLASGQSLASEPAPLLLGVTYSWLPESIDLMDGMTLGAGLGAAAGGLLGLILWFSNKNVEMEIFVVVGTIAGILFGTVAVAAGNANIL